MFSDPQNNTFPKHMLCHRIEVSKSLFQDSQPNVFLSYFVLTISYPRIDLCSAYTLNEAMLFFSVGGSGGLSQSLTKVKFIRDPKTKMHATALVAPIVVQGKTVD